MVREKACSSMGVATSFDAAYESKPCRDLGRGIADHPRWFARTSEIGRLMNCLSSTEAVVIQTMSVSVNYRDSRRRTLEPNG